MLNALITLLSFNALQLKFLQIIQLYYLSNTLSLFLPLPLLYLVVSVLVIKNFYH